MILQYFSSSSFSRTCFLQPIKRDTAHEICVSEIIYSRPPFARHFGALILFLAKLSASITAGIASHRIGKRSSGNSKFAFEFLAFSFAYSHYSTLSRTNDRDNFFCLFLFFQQRIELRHEDVT